MQTVSLGYPRHLIKGAHQYKSFSAPRVCQQHLFFIKVKWHDPPGGPNNT